MTISFFQLGRETAQGQIATMVLNWQGFVGETQQVDLVDAQLNIGALNAALAMSYVLNGTFPGGGGGILWPTHLFSFSSGQKINGNPPQSALTANPFAVPGINILQPNPVQFSIRCVSNAGGLPYQMFLQLFNRQIKG